MRKSSIRISSFKQEKQKKRIMKVRQDSKRSLLIFESAVRSEYTRKNYRCTLNRFMKFVKIDDHVNQVDQVSKEDISK